MPRATKPKNVDDEKPSTTESLDLPKFRVMPSAEWRKRLAEAQKLTAQKLCDVVYAMAREGASMQLIADYYGLDHKELSRVAHDAWTSGNSELVLSLFRDQIMTALHSKQIIAKIWVGKQFANQRDAAPISADVSPLGDGGLTINVNVEKATRDEQGNTVLDVESAGQASVD